MSANLNVPTTPQVNLPEAATLSQLVAQVEILSSTVQTSVVRINATNDLFRDYITEFGALSEQLVTLKENLLTSLEALHKSISENDQQIDDLAKITARIGQMELTYQQALQGAQAARS